MDNSGGSALVIKILLLEVASTGPQGWVSRAKFIPNDTHCWLDHRRTSALSGPDSFPQHLCFGIQGELSVGIGHPFSHSGTKLLQHHCKLWGTWKIVQQEFTGRKNVSCIPEKAVRESPKRTGAMQRLFSENPSQWGCSYHVPDFTTRGNVYNSTDSEVKSTGSNPTYFVSFPPPIPVKYSLSTLPRSSAVSYQRVKVTVIHLPLWKCLYLDETRFNSLFLYITLEIALLCIISRL